MSVLRYTLTRLSLLFAAAAVLYLAGARGLLLWLLAFVISGVLALFLLRGQRDDMSASIYGAVKRANARIDESTRREDLDDESEAPSPDDSHGDQQR